MYIYVIDCDSILKIGLHTSTYDTEKHEIESTYILPSDLYSHGLEKHRQLPTPNPFLGQIALTSNFSSPFLPPSTRLFWMHVSMWYSSRAT